ncbi:MAG: hypothetical protein ACYC3P_11155 [Bellilinea sp.]
MSEDSGTTATPTNEPFGDQVNRLVVELAKGWLLWDRQPARLLRI